MPLLAETDVNIRSNAKFLTFIREHATEKRLSSEFVTIITVTLTIRSVIDDLFELQPRTATAL